MPIANRSSSKARPQSAVRHSPKPGGTERPRSLWPLVAWLTELGTTEHWVVSCYLKLEPRDRSRGKYLIKLKNRIKERLAWLDARDVSRQEREAVETDLRRVREFLEDPGNLPVGQGIAVFACDALDLFEAIPLPRVFRSRLAVDRSPLVRELAAVHDEFGLVLCTVYDRTGARFFRATASGIEELTGLAAGETTRAGKFHGATRAGKPRGARAGTNLGAWGEHNYHQRIREEKQRHFARIAERLFELTRDEPVRGIVLASTGPEADGVEPHLHPYLARQLIGTARLNAKTATPAEVWDAVLEVRRDSERAWERAHVNDLEEGLGTRWAVNGIAPVLDALAHGQVRTLLVEPTVTTPGYRCAGSGRLTLDRAQCAADGDAEPVPDVIDEAIEEALRQSGHVDVVEDDELRAAVDGLAALLRFPKR